MQIVREILRDRKIAFGLAERIDDLLLRRIVQLADRRIDELTLKAARPALGTGPAAAQRSAHGLQHKAAFDTYVRKGESSGLRDLEAKALSIGSDPDGGYLVPDETERQVMSALKSVSPIRAIAGIRQVSGAVYKKPFSLTAPGTGWVGETAARSQTTTPTLSSVS